MSALQKIASGITQIPQQDLREVAGMNAFFIVPTNWRQQVGELFMDHPPMEKRLAALAKIAREMGKPGRLAQIGASNRANHLVRSCSTGSSFSSFAFSSSSRALSRSCLPLGTNGQNVPVLKP